MALTGGLLREGVTAALDMHINSALVLVHGLSSNRGFDLNHLCESKTMYPTSTAKAPVFGRHQFFGTSEHYGKAHGSLLSG